MLAYIAAVGEHHFSNKLVYHKYFIVFLHSLFILFFYNNSKKDKDEGAMRFYPVVKDTSKVPDPKTPRKKKTRHTSNPPFEAHVGWIMDVKSHRPRTTSTSSQLSARYIKSNMMRFHFDSNRWYFKLHLKIF